MEGNAVAAGGIHTATWTGVDTPPAAETDAAPEGGSNVKAALAEMAEQIQRLQEAVTMLFDRTRFAHREAAIEGTIIGGRLNPPQGIAPSELVQVMQSHVDSVAAEVERLHTLRMRIDV